MKISFINDNGPYGDKKKIVTQVAISLLYPHNRVPKQTSYDAKLVKFEKLRIYAARFVHFSASTTLVFTVLSHLQLFSNQS